jgi:nitrite reductase/ring-hydroxylating ferredoxin subunit
MTALQTNASEFNPNTLNLVKVASYDRLIRAPLERVWENVLDWEHLPYLHKTSFSYVELDTGGPWGWRTWSDESHNDHIELCIASDDSYVARSYQQGHQISEIWTRLTEDNGDTAINVEFHIPDVSNDDVDKLGNMMISLYTRLWDEDEAMMRQRHIRLHEHRSESAQQLLGSIIELKKRLSRGERIIFQLKQREFQLREHEGELIVHATICPHRLGPLTDCDLSNKILSCPWHGHQYDLDSGQCVFPPGATCSLSKAPDLIETDGTITARLG